MGYRNGWLVLASVVYLLLALPPHCSAVCQQNATRSPRLSAADSNVRSASLRPQHTSPYWPAETPLDPKIPSPKEHFGFEVGFRHLDHAQVVDYIERVVEASDRMTLRRYATSHGGRPLLMVTITSKKNRARLQKIRQSHVALAKPGAESVDIQNLPAVINMGYGVHGDESSATNCAPLVVYYLAAAQTQQVETWLDSCVVLLDPSLNPDGFNRFANWANRYRGVVVNPDPKHAEHNQMWPPGRVNYYWFDLNRDWLPAVHPESQGRLKNFHSWKPNVVLDFHEMGSGSTYFFQPGIPQRTNPLTPARNQKLTGKFARFHSKKLDQRGSLYFTQERFDDFYMGKGSTYPDLHGSVGILFEQASSRGHIQRTSDGLLSFHDTIANQFTTSLTSLEATTAMRKELLEYKRSFYRQSLAAAAKFPTQTFVFSVAHNPERLRRFARLLARHDIKCCRFRQDYDYGDQTLKATDSIVVPVAQSEYRFLRSLLMRQTNFRENIFYDVSSWTLPLAYGLKQTSLAKPIDDQYLRPWNETVSSSRKGEKDRQSQAANRRGAATFKFNPQAISYLIDYRNDAACGTLVQLLRAEVKVRVAMKPFSVKTRQGVRSFPRGTLSVVLANQQPKLETIRRILTRSSDRLKLTPVGSGLSVEGPDMGSPSFALIKPPKLAMLVGPSVSSYVAGANWHFIDRELRMPITLLKDRRISASRLREYTTLVVPDGSVSAENWEAIKSFANEGGNVVVSGRQASTFQQKLLAAKPETAKGKESSAKQPSEQAEQGSVQLPFDTASNKRALQLISGAIFKANADLTHPLLFGTTQKNVAVFRNHTSFLKPSSNAYRNPLVYDAKQPLLAGYCSDENQEKFKTSASVVVQPHGKGQFILMADDPNFRGFWHATRRLFLNALLIGEKMRVN